MDGVRQFEQQQAVLPPVGLRPSVAEPPHVRAGHLRHDREEADPARGQAIRRLRGRLAAPQRGAAGGHGPHETPRVVVPENEGLGAAESGHLQRLYEELAARGAGCRAACGTTRSTREVRVPAHPAVPAAQPRGREGPRGPSLRFNKFLEIGEGDYWGTLRETQLKQRALRHGSRAQPRATHGERQGGMLDGEDGGEDGEEDALSRVAENGRGGDGGDLRPDPGARPCVDDAREAQGARRRPRQARLRRQRTVRLPVNRAADHLDKRNSASAFPGRAPTAPPLTPASNCAAGADIDDVHLQVAITKPRVKAYPEAGRGRRDHHHTAVLVGPGSHEHNSMIGTQYESARSNDAYKWSNVWTGRLPRHLEPATCSDVGPTSPHRRVLHEFYRILWSPRRQLAPDHRAVPDCPDFSPKNLYQDPSASLPQQDDPS